MKVLKSTLDYPKNRVVSILYYPLIAMLPKLRISKNLSLYITFPNPIISHLVYHYKSQ